MHGCPLAGQELVEYGLCQQGVPEPVARCLAVDGHDRCVNHPVQGGKQLIGRVLREELQELKTCRASKGGEQTDHVAYARCQLAHPYVGKIAHSLGHA
jgi:hypothetical protein